MKVDKTSVDDLNAIITVGITKEDYQDKFKSELKKLAGKAQLKGFRKGKTPSSVIRKMYGKSVLAEVVNETLQKALGDYIVDEKLDIIGQPLPADDQDGVLNFDTTQLEDYEFKFEVGLSPDIDVQGVSTSDTYDLHNIAIDDKTIDEELDIARKRLGTQDHPDGQVEEKDILTIEAEELEGDQAKENGWATEFTVMVDTLADDKKEEILKLSKGDSFSFDIYNLEKERNEEYVKKYLLNLPKEEEEQVEVGNMFTGKIKDISRLVEAEMGQEFYDKYFGKDEVSSESEAREKVAEFVGKHYENQALQVMYRKIIDKLVADTQVNLPESFLRKWLKATNEKLSEDEIEKDFNGFLDNMKWTLIKSKLAKQFEIEVKPEDIREAMTNKVRGYFGQYGMDESHMGDILNRMMQNQEEVNKTYEEIQAGRLFEKIGEQVQHNKIDINLEDFNSLVKEMNEKQQAQ